MFQNAKRGPHSVATHYVLHFDSVVELHPIDDHREPFEPAQSSPAALGAQAELVDHREHSVAGRTFFRAWRGESDPVEPPIELAILLVSKGLGFARWIAAY